MAPRVTVISGGTPGIGLELAHKFIIECCEYLNTMFHAAGALHWNPTLTADGAEANAALHHLSPFGLTRGTLPLLQAAPDARVLIFSLLTQREVRLDQQDLTVALEQRPYRMLETFARAKKLTALTQVAWARQLSSGVEFAIYAPPGTHSAGLFSSSMPR